MNNLNNSAPNDDNNRETQRVVTNPKIVKVKPINVEIGPQHVNVEMSPQHGKVFEFSAKIGIPIIAAIVTLYILIPTIWEFQKQTEFAKNQTDLIANQLHQLKDQAENARKQIAAEQFKNAIDHLGSEKQTVVLGGVHALHNLAVNFDEYRQPVFEVLCSFIREETAKPEYQVQVLATYKPSDEIKKITPITTIPTIPLPFFRQPEKPKATSLIVIQTIVDKLFREKIEIDVINKETGERLVLYREYKANLSGAFLMGVDLSNAYLEEADLLKANLQGACLWDVNLKGADLYEVNMQGVDITGVNLQNADLRNANLQEAYLTHAETSPGVFYSTATGSQTPHTTMKSLQKASLNGVNLQGADLSGANLQKINLPGVNLQKADLSDAKLQKAYLKNAKLQDADLRYANMQEAYLKDAILQGADLRYVYFQGADLRHANMQGALLREVNLQGAYLQEVNLQETSLILADFRGVQSSDDSSFQIYSSYKDAIENGTGLKTDLSGITLYSPEGNKLDLNEEEKKAWFRECEALVDDLTAKEVQELFKVQRK